MVDFNVHPVLLSILGVYTAIAFIVTFFKPKLGLFLAVPIIGIGFENSSLIKGGFVAVISLAVVLHILASGERSVISRKLMPLFLIMLGLSGWILLRALLDGQSIEYWLEWVVKRIFAPGMLAFLAVLLLKKEKDVLQFAFVLIAFAIVTAAIGILQYLSPSDFFWHIREFLGVPASIAYQIVGRVRITGISSYVVPLSYQLSSILPIIFSFVLIKKAVNHRWFFAGSIALIFFCLLLTFIKAGIAAAVLGGLVVFILTYRSRLLGSQAILLYISAICCIFLFTLSDTVINQKVYSLGDTSYERIPIAFAAMNIVAGNPFGVGYEYHTHVKVMYDQISHFSGAEMALQQFPHNIILNLSVILGLPALLLAGIFYTYLFRQLFRVRKEGTLLLKTISIGLLGSFAAYIFIAMFHNNSPFFGDAFNWLLIGLALSIININALSRRDVLLE